MRAGLNQKKLKEQGDYTMIENDHDLLIKIDTCLKVLQKQFSNHLAHHWAITISLLGIAATTTVTLLIFILKNLGK